MKLAKGKSISVFSTKGGAGKTTTALNIAGVFSRLEKKVLIIDFDMSSGAIATYLNVPFKRSIASIQDDYLNHAFHDISLYVTKYNDYIDFLASPLDPREGSRIMPALVSLIIEKAQMTYDFVICDMNHVLNEFNLTILDNTTLSLLVLTNDLLDLKNMCNLIRIFKDIGKKNYRLLLNGSVNGYKKYYSLYDIKSIIKCNIDYNIEPNFFLKTMDSYVTDGKILTLEDKMPKAYPSVYKTYEALCHELMEDTNE